MKLEVVNCGHKELKGKRGYHDCSCGQRFYVKAVEIIGSSRRKVPYIGVHAIPSNFLGWYVGESVVID